MQHEYSTPNIKRIVAIVGEEEWVMNTANEAVNVKFRYQSAAGSSRETLDSKCHQERYDGSQKRSPVIAYQYPRAHSLLP
jgi:hypothetical protein